MPSRSKFRHLYRVTHSTHPNVAVGKLLTDKGRLLVRDWTFIDLTTGEESGSVVGKRLNRLCLRCYDEYKRGTEYGHPGECGPDVPPVTPSDEAQPAPDQPTEPESTEPEEQQ